MASLGTLDMAAKYGVGSSGLDTFDKYMAKQIVTDGSDTDKLAYLIGGMLGNYYGKQRSKKDNKKIDAILDEAKKDPVTGVEGVITEATPEQQKFFNDQQSIASAYTPTGSATTIGELPATANQTDLALQSLYGSGNASVPTFTQTPTNNGMNNYNWKYIQDEARRQGISGRVLESRKADIQKNIAQRAGEIFLPQIQQSMLGSTVTDKDGKQTFKPATTESMLNGLQLLNEYAKYDEAGAKDYTNKIMTMAAADKNFGNQLQLAELNHKNARDIAQMQVDARKYAADKTAANVQNRINNSNQKLQSPSGYLKSVGFSDFAALEKAINAYKVIDETTGKYKPLSAEDNKQLSNLIKIRDNYNYLLTGGSKTTPPQDKTVSEGDADKGTAQNGKDAWKSTRAEIDDEIESNIGAVLSGDGDAATKVQTIQSYLVNDLGVKDMDDPDLFHKTMKKYMSGLGYGTQAIRDALKYIPSLDNIEDFPDVHPNLSYYDERNKRNAKAQQNKK